MEKQKMEKRVSNICFITLISICFIVKLQAQTLRTLSAEQLIQIIKKYHPVALQAGYATAQAKANVLQTRGIMDPFLQSAFGNKNLSDVNYYSYAEGNLSVPIWYGIDVTTGVKQIVGNRLDESETTGGISYLGVNIPLTKNWIIDKRKGYIQQAQTMQQLALAEQQAIVNNLCMEAISTYWNWVSEYAEYQLLNEVASNILQRNTAIKKSYILGERPAIDTIEALAQYQSILYQANDHYINYIKQTWELSTYMWQQNNEPYIITDTIVPANWDNTNTYKNFTVQYQDLLNAANANHPELNIYKQKLNFLAIDKKIKKQDIMPKVDLQYNLLSKNAYTNFTPAAAFGFTNNYQYGIKVEMPLLLRQARGAYQNILLKIDVTQSAQAAKQQAIFAKVNSYFNEYILTQKQVSLQSDNVINYKKLVTAEEQRFFNGEGSVFLINSRENKLLETDLKLIELKCKFYKSIYGMQWSAGLLQ